MMPAMRHLFRLWVSSLLFIVSSAALAQQALIVADDATSAKAFRPQVGKVATFVCPSNLKPTTPGVIGRSRNRIVASLRTSPQLPH
jgi:hypothetical protein